MNLLLQFSLSRVLGANALRDLLDGGIVVVAETPKVDDEGEVRVGSLRVGPSQIGETFRVTAGFSEFCIQILPDLV